MGVSRAGPVDDAVDEQLSDAAAAVGGRDPHGDEVGDGWIAGAEVAANDAAGVDTIPSQIGGGVVAVPMVHALLPVGVGKLQFLGVR